MSTKKEELVAIAREGGYEGDMPGTTAEAIKVAAGYVGGGGSGGGGGELFIVKITVTNTQSGTTITADKTFAEIGEAVRASLPVWALITGLTDGSNDVWNYQLMPLSDFCDAATYSEYQYADFYGLGSQGGQITYIRINSNNDVEKNNIATKHGLS